MSGIGLHGVRGADPVGPRMAWRFAARIASRHRRRAIRCGIGLPLAAAARVSMQHVVHRHTRFGDVINARLDLRLHVHRTVVTHRTPASREVGMPHASAEDRAETLAGLADRLRLRARRLEVRGPKRSAPQQSGSEPQQSSAPHQLPPRKPAFPAAARDVVTSLPPDATSMTLARPFARSRAQPRSDADRSGGDGRATRAEESRARHAMRTKGGPRPLAPSFPEGEIERLADRVIGSIDRRIAAQRERLGRF